MGKLLMNKSNALDCIIVAMVRNDDRNLLNATS